MNIYNFSKIQRIFFGKYIFMMMLSTAFTSTRWMFSMPPNSSLTRTYRSSHFSVFFYFYILFINLLPFISAFESYKIRYLQILRFLLYYQEVS
mmetsp:Transcript_4121/g.7900  ORF Transcript_4121/g.7900 Transcript_4121/m.7900 type:complete len:93 (+) Transcript_4121:246-524(+)